MIKIKRFTLTELLIVLVIIGVLAAIIVPNISNFKEDGTTAAMQANIKNIETALTMYSMENNGSLPIVKKAELGNPEPLLLDQLHPTYLRSKPKVKGMKYWLDYTNKVWASSADSPVGIIYTTDGKLKWEKAKKATSYNIFKTVNNEAQSSVQNNKVVFIQNTEKLELSLPKLEGDNFYLVNSVDNFGLESPPVNSEYQGDLIEGQLPENGLSRKEKFPWPMNLEQVEWKNNEPELTDGNMSTFYPLYSNKEYLFEWEGDMANRVFMIAYHVTSQNSNLKNFNFLDKNGKIIPFINAQTDEPYLTYSANYESFIRVIEFVIPRGATQLKVHGGADIRLYQANLVKDLSLPYAVENVTSTATKESIRLNWSKPSNSSNFSNVAVYDGNQFLGYGSNGSFTVNSLYSDKEYQFSLEPISVVRNRGPRIEHTNKTSRPEIVWSGLDNAKAFDSSSSTYATAVENSIIRWEGDLANRQIVLTYQNSNTNSTRYVQFSFYDDKGKVINSKLAEDNTTSGSFRMYGSNSISNLRVLVPEGATHIKFSASNTDSKIYNISYGDTLDFPSKLTDIEATSTPETITLQFKRPSDVVRVAIYRDGIFLTYTTSNIFTDTSLYSGKEYTYTFETYNSSGHRTIDAGSIKKNTIKEAITWSGLDNGNAFDSSLSTYATASHNSVIRWEGDLTNRQVALYYQNTNTNSTRYIQFSFYNDQGLVIKSKASEDNTLTNVFSMYGEASPSYFKVIVPAGATHIKFSASNTDSKIYNISYGSTLAFPNKLTDIEATSTSEIITLRLNRPKDVSRVAVFRDGIFLNYTTSDVFTDKSLYSDKEYTYTFETYNSSGHRTSNAGVIKKKTEPKEINWSGLNDGNAFDSSMSTYSTASHNSVIRWDGDLSNRQIELYYQNTNTNSTRYIQFSFYNNQGLVIKSKESEDNTLTNVFSMYGKASPSYFKVIVPEGATHIKFSASNTDSNIFNISYGSTLSFPSKLSEVQATSTTETITLTLNRPSDVYRVAIFRDGTFLTYTNSSTFTDKSLYSDREYTYTFETYNSSGHRTSAAGTIQKRTERTEIVWSGLDNANAFDSSTSTYSTASTNSVIRWDGDLTNRQITFRYQNENINSTRSVVFSFYDDKGRVVNSKKVGDATLSSSFSLTGNSSILPYKVIVPAGASYIKFGSSSTSAKIYDLLY